MIASGAADGSLAMRIDCAALSHGMIIRVSGEKSREPSRGSARCRVKRYGRVTWSDGPIGWRSIEMPMPSSTLNSSVITARRTEAGSRASNAAEACVSEAPKPSMRCRGRDGKIVSVGIGCVSS